MKQILQVFPLAALTVLFTPPVLAQTPHRQSFAGKTHIATPHFLGKTHGAVPNFLGHSHSNASSFLSNTHGFVPKIAARAKAPTHHVSGLAVGPTRPMIHGYANRPTVHHYAAPVHHNLVQRRHR